MIIRKLTRITIPDSVTRVGAQAFWDERRFGNVRPFPDRVDSRGMAVVLRPVENEIHITLGANVALEGNPFRYGRVERWSEPCSATGWGEGFRGFNRFHTIYAENGRQAGTYSFTYVSGRIAIGTRNEGGRWEGGGADLVDLVDLQEQGRRRQRQFAVAYVAAGVVILGLLALPLIIFGPAN